MFSMPGGREIGNAFLLYSNEFKQTFPVAVHSVGLTGTPVPINVERRWYDLVAKFISNKGKNFTTYTDITAIRANSLLIVIFFKPAASLE